MNEPHVDREPSGPVPGFIAQGPEAGRSVPLWIFGVGRAVVGAVIGAFVAGALVLAWGDARYVRHSEFAQHSTEQEKAAYISKADFDSHSREDRVEFNALRDQVAQHIALPSHPGTAVTMAAIQAQLAQIQTDLQWIKVNLPRRGAAAAAHEK